MKGLLISESKSVKVPGIITQRYLWYNVGSLDQRLVSILLPIFKGFYGWVIFQEAKHFRDK